MDIHDQSQGVYADHDGAIGRIVLNRVAKKNALTCAMWEGVEHAAKALEEHPGVRVIMLVSAAPGAFAAGADIKELTEIANDTGLRERNRMAIRGAQRTLARVKKPTIALIDGPCMGGGCGLAAHCDFRLASARAKFGVTPAKLGLVYPQSDLKRLHDLVGARGARRLLLTAQAVDAEQAFAMGLVDEVLPAEHLAARGEAFAAMMAALSPFSLAAIKESLIKVEDGAVDDDADTVQLFLDAHLGGDASEGLTAFLEKRPPRFADPQ